MLEILAYGSHMYGFQQSPWEWREQAPVSRTKAIPVSVRPAVEALIISCDCRELIVMAEHFVNMADFLTSVSHDQDITVSYR